MTFLSRTLIGKILTAPFEAVRFVYHLPRLLILVHRLIRDPRVPFYLKLIPTLALVYIVFPIDLLKDFGLGPIGYLDDVIVTFYLLKTFLRMCPKEVVAEHVERLSLPPSPGGVDPGPRSNGAG